MIACYLAIWALTKIQSMLIESTYIEAVKGDVNLNTFMSIKYISYFISFSIVIFNKFVLGKYFFDIGGQNENYNKNFTDIKGVTPKNKYYPVNLRF